MVPEKQTSPPALGLDAVVYFISLATEIGSKVDRLLMQPQLVTPRFSGNAEINHLNEECWIPNKEAGSWWQPTWSPDLMLKGWVEIQGETEPLLAPMSLLLEHVIPLLFKLIWACVCFPLLMRMIYNWIRVKEISSRNFRTARMKL